MSEELDNKFDHEEREHAKFSPSGAERWLFCPGSIPLLDFVPEEHKITNKWAIAGTQAHKVLEMHLHGKDLTEFPAEYQHHARTALQWIKLKYSDWKTYRRVSERRFYAGYFFGIDDDDLHGSSDLTLYDVKGLRLRVIDYKYGTKKVLPEKNFQLMIYAIGAFIELFLENDDCPEITKLNDITKVDLDLVILQPRITNGCNAWSINWKSSDTKKWLKMFIQGVKAAHSEVGKLEAEMDQYEIDCEDLKEDPDWDDFMLNMVNPDDYFQYGSWCYWCHCKHICPSWRDQRLEAFEDESSSFENAFVE